MNTGRLNPDDLDIDRLCTDEDAARAYLEAVRWPNGPVCPHCDATGAYTLSARLDSESPVRPGVFKCKVCRRQFTARIGTIFEDSKIPIRKWLKTIDLMTSPWRAVGSPKIGREVDITVKSVWFMVRRIREAMRLADSNHMNGTWSCKPGQSGRKYEKMLYLAPLSFADAVKRVVAAKPAARRPNRKIDSSGRGTLV